MPFIDASNASCAMTFLAAVRDMVLRFHNCLVAHKPQDAQAGSSSQFWGRKQMGLKWFKKKHLKQWVE
jgi:hypothetical protein